MQLTIDIPDAFWTFLLTKYGPTEADVIAKYVSPRLALGNWQQVGGEYWDALVASKSTVDVNTAILTAASTNSPLWFAGESALIATTAMNPYTIVYDFEGTMIVPPGVTVYLVGSAASGALIAQSLWWLEIPA